MTHDIRTMLDEAALKDEPPSGINGDDMVERGRRRNRRRLGLAVSGITLGVTAVAAAALLLPSLAGGPATLETGTAAPGAGKDADGGEGEWAMSTDRLSEEIREALGKAFPDVTYTMASGWDIGDEAFDFLDGEEKGVDQLLAYGDESTQGPQLVGVELYLPGDFSTEPSDSPAEDQDADEFLIDCGTRESGDTKVVAECDEKDLGDQGLLRTSDLTESTKDKATGFQITSAIYRTDGSAIVLKSMCFADDGDGPAKCDRDSFGTVDFEAAQQFLTAMPPIVRQG